MKSCCAIERYLEVIQKVRSECIKVIVISLGSDQELKVVVKSKCDVIAFSGGSPCFIPDFQ
jgi:hypothetical protein